MVGLAGKPRSHLDQMSFSHAAQQCRRPTRQVGCCSVHRMTCGIAAIIHRCTTEGSCRAYRCRRPAAAAKARQADLRDSKSYSSLDAGAWYEGAWRR